MSYQEQDTHVARLHRVREALLSYARSPRAQRGVDALLVTNIVNVAYLTGFSGTSAVVVISKDAAAFYTDFRYFAQAQAQCPVYDVRMTTSLTESVRSLIDEHANWKRIAFEAANLTVDMHGRYVKPAQNNVVRWIPTVDIVENLRMIKDESELEAIRVAIAQRSLNAVAGDLRPGTTESAFALALEAEMRRQGADKPSFDTIVASGPQGALPHHHPNDRVLEPGDLVTIDYGALANGYCSDITRTVLVPGGPCDPEKQRIYDIVNEAKNRAIAAIRPGATGKEIDAIARDHIIAAGHGEHFGHSLGHSIGREVHDGQTLSSRADKVILTPGVVTTVEPGIYINGWGGVRIEEDVLVTETGHEVLTESAGGLTTLG
jgi:Xaa-Pro aminopeptidase